MERIAEMSAEHSALETSRARKTTREKAKLFFISSDLTVLSSRTWSKRLVLKEDARLLGLTQEVVAPQGRLWVVYHLGGNGRVIRRHSVYVALWVLLQHKVKTKSYLSPHSTKVMNAKSLYHIIRDNSYPSR